MNKLKTDTQSLQSCVSVSVTASELRIGNLLHFPFTAETVKVLGINAREYKSEIIHTISFEKGINLYCEKHSVLKPIPLSNDARPLLRSNDKGLKLFHVPQASPEFVNMR